jgi:succinyl-diaminopimelate desuccinylase
VTGPFEAGPLAALVLELVEVPSVTGQEAALANLVEERCRALPGAAVERLGNAVIARTGPPDAPAPALVGHLDTVPAWEGHTPRRQGDRVIGRGAADMKGGDAAVLAVLERAAATGTPAVAVLYDREEGPNDENGMHRVLELSALLGRPPLALVAEPTGSIVHAGCVGSLIGRLTVRGRTGHSARPWEGENAIAAAVPFLQRATASAPRPVVVDGLTFHETLSVTMIAGGVAVNVIPDEVVVGVNARFAPGRTAGEAQAEIEALADGVGTWRWDAPSPSAPPALENPHLQRFLGETGVAVEPKQAWTDVATLAAAGIPAVNLGPGEPSQAHQPEEWVEGAAIARVAALFAAALGL